VFDRDIESIGSGRGHSSPETVPERLVLEREAPWVSFPPVIGATLLVSLVRGFHMAVG